MADIATATLGGGCFWCTEAVFKQVQGVESVQSGYSGGHDPAPTYESVCGGRTGHAEVVQIRFDPQQISFAEVLEIFFKTHDPTTANRQGNDVGPQYRSAIFYHDDQQKQIAEQMIRELNSSGAFPRSIVTQVVPFEKFFAAENYHDNYYDLHSNQPYCQFVIHPKISKFRKEFSGKLAPEKG